MKINFSVLNFAYFNNRSNTTTNKYHLKDIPFDTFERISFQKTLETDTVTHNFEIKNIKNMRCPVCGLIMLTDEQINSFINDIKDKRGFELVDTLEKYEDDSIFTGIKQDPPRSIYRPQKQEIVNVIKDLAKQYPSKTLSELVELEANNRIDKLIETQLKIVNELEQYVKSSKISKLEKTNINKIIEEYTKQIKGESDEQFSRKRFIYALSDVTRYKAIQSRITKIIEKLPSSEQDVNSWFVKYSRPLKSNEIAKKFVQQSIPSAEHLLPRSKNGANNIRNYICDCADCNSKRSDMEFYKWMKTIPNFEQNLKDYLQDVQDAIDAGILSQKYDGYISSVIKTIEIQSQGEMLLDVPNSSNPERNRKILFKRQAKIAEITKNIDEQIKLRRKKAKEFKNIELHPYYQSLLNIDIYQKQLEDLQEEIDDCDNPKEYQICSSEMRNLKSKIELCKKHISEFETIDSRLEALTIKVEHLRVLREELSKVESVINENAELINTKQRLISDNENMEKQNSEILQNPDFDVKNLANYKKYTHFVELIETANNMLKKINLQSKDKRYKEAEIIQAGIEKLNEIMSYYLKFDDVIYFVNEEKIKANNAIIKNIDKKTEGFNENFTQYEQCREKINQESEGKTFEELTKELNQLIEASKIAEKIKNIETLQQELKYLEETIEYNRNILKNLRNNYETMTNEEFIEQANLIYYKGSQE